MKFAAISDVHGNCDALDAVLAGIAAQGVDDIVNLGDHFSGPLAALATAERLIPLALPSIRGNCDRTMVETAPSEMSLSDRAACAQLSSRHIDWLKNLPPTLIYRDEVFLCHGTPRSDETYWLEQVDPHGTVSLAPLAAIRAAAEGFGHSLMLCGHSHVPRAIRIPGGPLIVNPGSVGLPAYDHEIPVPHLIETGTPHAKYAILEKQRGAWHVTFHSVPYDTQAMATLARIGNRPVWANALERGWIKG